MAKSILSNKKECYLCGARSNLHKHHIMDGTNRKLAERDGLWVYLCQPHHIYSPQAVHSNRQQDLSLRKVAQKAYEDLHGHEAWMQRYKRNYLEVLT